MVLLFIFDLIIKTLMICAIVGFFLFVCGLKLYMEPYNRWCKCKTKLDGKVAVVTGGNSGIGFEIAKGLAQRGARVIVACRNEEKSRYAIADIVRITGNMNVEFRYLDLSKSRTIRNFVEDFSKAFDRLDILVNNAGAGVLPETPTEDGIDMATQINYIGPFYLTNLLLEKVIGSKPCRIVIVASYAHNHHDFDINDVAGKRKLGIWKKYCNSKLYNVMWTKALAKRLPEDVTVNSLHPGTVYSDIYQRANIVFRWFVYIVIALFFRTAEGGAQTPIHLCIAPGLEKVSGKYFRDCRVIKTAKIANNDKMVERLWEETMMLVENKFLNNN